MPVVLLLFFALWALGFWPMMALTGYILNQLDPKTSFSMLESGLGLFVLFCTWTAGMNALYRLYEEEGKRRSTDDDEDSVSNAFIVVERPDDKSEYLESRVYLKSLPQIGERFALNGDTDDDADILGTVVEAAKMAHTVDDTIKYCVWITLDYSEDYEELWHRDSWEMKSDDIE